MAVSGSFKSFTDSLPLQDERMPLLFIGHGSPMNGIEDNEFSNRWKQMGTEIPVPKAVLVISAHWLTRGTHITAMPEPKTIHDFGGFPQALYEVDYPAPGDPQLAFETKQLITKTDVGLDHDWGLDHGTWTVVRHMYPQAQVPVVQLSIDYHKPANYHYELASELSALRRKGVLIIGSGNMVHNLRMVDWTKVNEPDFGYDWAVEMNEVFKTKILNQDHPGLINYDSIGTAARYAIPTPDHYYPLLYILGLQEKDEHAEFFNDKAIMGSLTMTSVKINKD
ncbi:MAG: 4,5-DOPA dioxygenase extradiol [Cyclobacteriaceae bacterium]|jgi:4,5-DOPA dioxygenase extradiol|nr:4,5-DOPA dioxygenase extradiol [Cyclobacteriaceae bacterium]